MIAKPPPLRRWATNGHARRGLLATLLLAGTTMIAAPDVRGAETISCPSDGLNPHRIQVGGNGDNQPDLIVNDFCQVDELGDYHFGNVNVVNGGKLVFIEPDQATDKNATNFWAKSIIIEDGGLLSAGVGIPEHNVPDTPYGVNGNTLNFIIYGKDEVGANFSYDPNRDLSKDNLGAACIQERCGVEEAFWQHDPESRVTQDNGVTDYFYMYHGLSGDSKPHADGVQAGEPGYFGKKSLGLGYGGSLQLRGYKGTQLADDADKDPTSSGTSWIRLGAHLEKGKNALTLDREPTGWAPGDRIIVTTTDYVPAHTEEFTIAKITGKTIEFEAGQTAQYFHNGEVYDTKLKDAPDYFTKVNGKGGADENPLLDHAETRAAVGLLTRSIRIVSGGDVAGEAFDLEPGQTPEGKTATEKNPKYQFGAHTVFRQGFEKLQMQGVEFRWLGQGGRLGHYPVHFHMARDVPADTYIKDSSVNESMTRWMVLHATRGVTLQRNVGYKSIGHGYYLEDATEAENRLYANLGVMARAGVKGPLNPREIPGILAHGYQGGTGGDDAARTRSDVLYPTAFWITNGWNDFVGNMAAGTGTCGTCYWLMPAGDNNNMKNMKWSGYSELQHRMSGTSPLKRFYKNYCTSSMHAFNAVGSTSDCTGVTTLDPAGNPADVNRIVPVKSFAPNPSPERNLEAFYPNTTGDRSPTVCSPSDDPAQDTCRTVNKCDYAQPGDCATTVLDSFTTQFNWAETNFAAIWLRKGWNLVDRLFMSDIQNGGIGMVTGGDYTRSSVPLGFWSLLAHSVFVGETQPDNGFASPSGPKGPDGKTVCAGSPRLGNTCIEKDSSVAYPLSNWATNRMINIYDGPFYQEANAYLEIQPSDCKDFETCMYRHVNGVRLNKKDPSKGYLPNAAIGWKQPNGFYYPPAFDSRDLYFRDVAIRHYLTVPLFKKGTYMADPELVKQEFFAAPNDVPSNYFSGFTDVDRQTVLNDMDGTLTGFEKTISVNMDPFFSAPVQTPECLSNLGVTETGACAKNEGKNQTTPTARTSPYDYVTTVIYPACASKENSGNTPFPCGSDTENVQESTNPPRFTKMRERGGPWSKECGGPFCTGVRLYRQYLTDGSSANAREMQDWESLGCDKNPGKAECDFPFIRLAGMGLWQRSALTANHGKYYVDTTRSREFQRKEEALGAPDDQVQTYVECEFRKQGNCEPRSVSVFEEKKTYYLFLVFAKEDTRQVYQMYVGPNFKLDSNAATGLVKPIRVKVPGIKFEVSDWTDAPDAWTMELVPGADGKTKDILQVTFDYAALPKMSKPINVDPKKEVAELCKPASFCELKNGSCGCSLKDPENSVEWLKSGLKGTCEEVCKTWTVKALDCPDGGCLGFAVTMPEGFEADDQNHRPEPEPFRDTKTRPDSPWLTTGFTNADKVKGGACYYSKANTPSIADGSKCEVAD